MKAQEDVCLGRLLSPELVWMRPPHKDRAPLLDALVRRLCSVKALGGADSILSKIAERERDGIDTTLDTGLSLPHAHVRGVAEPAAALAVLSGAGISNSLNPKIPIRAMLVLISPDNPETYKQHLRLLREVARVFQSPLIDRLAFAGTSSEALEHIRRVEASL